MKNHWDKLAFVLSIFILAATNFVFLKQRPMTDRTPMLLSLVSSTPYDPVQKIKFDTQKIQWLIPEVQNKERHEVFEIFAPPKIFWDKKTSKFVFDVPPKEIRPFGLRLIGMDRQLYRIQYNGYLGDPQKKVKLLLADIESKKTFKGAPGQEFKDREIKIISFKLKSIKGTILRKPELIIYDQRSQKEVHLGREPYYSPDKYTITVEVSSGKTTKKLSWSQKGQKLRLDQAVFTLLDFDLQNGTIKVLKSHLDKKFADETKILSISPRPKSTKKSPLP